MGKEERLKALDLALTQIEKDFGKALLWQRMDGNVTSRIKYQLDGVSVFEEADYPKMNEFLIDAVTRMKRAFAAPINNLE